MSGIVCIQSLWSQWREEKSIFRSLHELSMVRHTPCWSLSSSWWSYYHDGNDVHEIIVIIVMEMVTLHSALQAWANIVPTMWTHKHTWEGLGKIDDTVRDHKDYIDHIFVDNNDNVVIIVIINWGWWQHESTAWKVWARLVTLFVFKFLS